MILYHAIWDMVYLFGCRIDWYVGIAGQFWQQFICMGFILISGFSFMLGKNPYKRALIVFLSSISVSIVSFVLFPEWRIEFGILSLLSFSIFITALFKNIIVKMNPKIGIVISLVLFILTKNMASGYLGLADFFVIKLPKWLYQKGILTYLGFASPDVRYGDYFPIIPWYFLFILGVFLFLFIFKKTDGKYELGSFFKKRIAGLDTIGRHSLIIYLCHQPIIYVLLMLIFKMLSF